MYPKLCLTRSTHAHDASRRAVQVHMCACGWAMWSRCQKISQSSRRTTVESNMKSEHNLYLACEDCTTRFALSLVLFLPSWLLLYIDFVAFSFSVSPTVGCVPLDTAKHGTSRRTRRAVLPALHCQEAPFFPVLNARHPRAPR